MVRISIGKAISNMAKISGIPLFLLMNRFGVSYPYVNTGIFFRFFLK